MKLYHLFKVWDYKGGKLSTSLNNTRIEAAQELMEYLNIYELFDSKFKELIDIKELSEDPNEEGLKTLKRAIKSFIKSEEFTSIVDKRQGNYGGSDYCYQIYQSKDDCLTEVDYHKFRKYFPEIYIENL